MEKHCECKVSWKFMNPLTAETGQNNDAVDLARVFMGCLKVLSADFPAVGCHLVGKGQLGGRLSDVLTEPSLSEVFQNQVTKATSCISVFHP